MSMTGDEYCHMPSDIIDEPGLRASSASPGLQSVIVIMWLQPAWGACMDHQLGFQCLAGSKSQGYLEKTDTSKCVMSALNLIRADNRLYGQAL